MSLTAQQQHYRLETFRPPLVFSDFVSLNHSLSLCASIFDWTSCRFSWSVECPSLILVSCTTTLVSIVKQNLSMCLEILLDYAVFKSEAALLMSRPFTLGLWCRVSWWDWSFCFILFVLPSQREKSFVTSESTISLVHLFCRQTLMTHVVQSFFDSILLSLSGNAKSSSCSSRDKNQHFFKKWGDRKKKVLQCMTNAMYSIEKNNFLRLSEMGKNIQNIKKNISSEEVSSQTERPERIGVKKSFFLI